MRTAQQLRTAGPPRAQTAECARWYKAGAEYPGELLDLPVAPDLLFALGARSTLDVPRVAIVGTRDCSGYGDRTARKIASAIARAGGCVVSGMARGVDACAHRAALEAGGRTVAVLGTGVDVPYPRGHAQLHAQLAEHGLVLSESPPGTAAFRGCFPRRNRIIAALAQVTIVVEAGHKSGALLTAKNALDLGRTVAAVPGPIDSPNSAGTNELLRDGAHVIATVDDALTLAGFPAAPELPLPDLTDTERALWDALGKGAAQLDVLAMRSGMTLRDCMSAMTSLELRGLASSGYAGEYRRN
ncbi:MAG: DNA-protecting protein DprA [Gemmatimonadaceae bacterium]|nr:DNA-protecting protein DprA [Gemmatimonadaceae bacterium]